MSAPPNVPPPRAIESDEQWPFLAAAAVLTTFDASRLRPIDGGDPDIARVGEMLAQYGEPVTVGPARGQWRLSDGVRREVLTALGERGALKQALDCNPEDRPDNPTQRALTELSSPRTGVVDLSGRSLDDLLGMERAVDWLGSAKLRGLPERRFVLSQVERLKLLEPLRRLVANGFEGRTQEMLDLRTYVDQLPSASIRESFVRTANWLRDVFSNRPILVLHGPGGSGKSTLVAKFVMDHAGPGLTSPMPFVYLDFEHQALMPPSAGVITAEALRQLRIQFPDAKTPPSDANRWSAGSDLGEQLHIDDVVFEELAALLNELAQKYSQNILFVIDTFELVQRRGITAVYTVLVTAADLQARCPRLRIVVVGRSDLRKQDFQFSSNVPAWTPKPLSGFDLPSGRAFLTARLKAMKATIPNQATLDRVVTLVRFNPLGLRLAATVLAQSGAAGVEDALSQQVINEQIAQEQIQGMLHTRIIEQLTNPRLKRLANPGLIVRRITAPVIEHVLAKACDLTFDAQNTPEALLNELRNEVALVEIVDDTTLKHRADVRLLMLPLLRHELGDTARQIDLAAVEYWTGEPGPAARAEEIYHRLWLGEEGPALEPRWMPGAAPFLEDALDEFAAVAPSKLSRRIWLAQKLGRELPEEIRKSVGQLAWESDMLQKANTLMASGRFGEVVSIVRERPAAQRTAASPIWLVEIDALQLQGQPDQAAAVADDAIARMTNVDDPDHLHALLTRKTAAEEARGRVDSALSTARTAAKLAGRMRDPKLIFGSTITLGRLLAQTGPSGDTERASCHEQLGGLLDSGPVQKALADHPALLREAAAELGADYPRLLVTAIEQLGLWSSSPMTEIPDSIGQQFGFSGKFEGPNEARRFEAQVARELKAAAPQSEVARYIARLFGQVVSSNRRPSPS